MWSDVKKKDTTASLPDPDLFDADSNPALLCEEIFVAIIIRLMNIDPVLIY